MRDRDVIVGTLSRAPACTMSALFVVKLAGHVRGLIIKAATAWPKPALLIVRGVERGA
jgi:hypothetical protein